MKNIKHSLASDGVGFRVHGNAKRLPKHILSLYSVEYVIRFLLNYTQQHGLLLPGRVPGYSRDDIKPLPSSVSKRGIWKVYHEAAQKADSIHAVAYTTFCLLWRKQLPQVRLMKPMTDLCWTCQQNSTAILRAANQTDGEKSDTLKAKEHLRIVSLERSLYKTSCDECSKSILAHFTDDEVFHPLPVASQTPANSQDIQSHYSFDYAQQIHYPSDPMQPGPIYFLVPRKCSVFGVNYEGIPRQVNFLCDEAGDCGKGANTVVSQLHFFFETHGLGEKQVFLHADNCTGQNKNNCMLQYLAWRAMTGRHTQITLSFLVVGHTKFAPDWCFGLFKRLFRRTKVGSLKGIAQVANDSAVCNCAQLNCTEDGTVIVPSTIGLISLLQGSGRFQASRNYTTSVLIPRNLEWCTSRGEERTFEEPLVMHLNFLLRSVRKVCPLIVNGTCTIPSASFVLLRIVTLLAQSQLFPGRQVERVPLR